jgi:hypothetical protein
MSQTERRKDERLPFRRPSEGALLLKTSNAVFPIHEIKDISNSGISIHIEHDIGIASKVVIEYATAKMKIEVNGAVAWCVPIQRPTNQPSDKPGFSLGIELLSPMLFFAMWGQSNAQAAIQPVT